MENYAAELVPAPPGPKKADCRQRVVSHHHSPPSRESFLGSHHTWYLLRLKSRKSGIIQVRGHMLKADFPYLTIPDTGQPKVHPRELPVGGSIGDEKRGGGIFHPTQL